MPEFAARLIAWQRQHGRHDLPWQQESTARRDPYRIWLSEIMLQQTRVATVIPYYERFLARFPDLASLAAAEPEAVLALWSGLGYYARARNLHRCAQRIVAEHGGAFPRDPDVIARLPGIGRSTAAAIAAFAFGARAAILDGNVKRVLCRRFGIDGFPGDKRVEDRLWALAQALLPAAEIETYTQGLMDLGASVCSRSRPDCAGCPLGEECIARRERRISALPAPRARRALPQRGATVLLLLHGERILLEQRPPAGIWGGLLALPEYEPNGTPLADYLRQRFDCTLHKAEPLARLRHGFTHFKLELRPILCRVTPGARQVHDDRLRWLALREAAGAALPAPVRTLLARVDAASGAAPPAA